MTISNELTGKKVLLEYEIKKHKHSQCGVLAFIDDEQVLFKPFGSKGFTVDFKKIFNVDEIKE